MARVVFTILVAIALLSTITTVTLANAQIVTLSPIEPSLPENLISLNISLINGSTALLENYPVTTEEAGLILSAVNTILSNLAEDLKDLELEEQLEAIEEIEEEEESDNGDGDGNGNGNGNGDNGNGDNDEPPNCDPSYPDNCIPINGTDPEPPEEPEPEPPEDGDDGGEEGMMYIIECDGLFLYQRECPEDIIGETE